jgi:hypothetical protein
MVLMQCFLQAPVLPTYYSHLVDDVTSEKRPQEDSQPPTSQAVPAQTPPAGPQYGALKPAFAWNAPARPSQIGLPASHQYGQHLPPESGAHNNRFANVRPQTRVPFSGEYFVHA